MLEQALKDMIPGSYSVFDKLREESAADPYKFGSWDSDEIGSILRYWFWSKNQTRKNKKRLYMPGLRDALIAALRENLMDRKTWSTNSPRGLGDGRCGFVVAGRCLEFLGVADYQGHGRGFAITNVAKARQLIGS